MKSFFFGSLHRKEGGATEEYDTYLISIKGFAFGKEVGGCFSSLHFIDLFGWGCLLWGWGEAHDRLSPRKKKGGGQMAGKFDPWGKKKNTYERSVQEKNTKRKKNGNSGIKLIKNTNKHKKSFFKKSTLPMGEKRVLAGGGREKKNDMHKKKK